MEHHRDPSVLSDPYGGGGGSVTNNPVNTSQVNAGSGPQIGARIGAGGGSGVGGDQVESTHPPLYHTRTAPTTVPVNPVYQQSTDGAKGGGLNEPNVHTNSYGSNTTGSSVDESPTPILTHLGDRDHGTVPLSVGGLHGQRLTGSRAQDEGNGIGEIHGKDHQAAGMGGRKGPAIAALATKELGLDSEHRDTFDEKARAGVDGAPPAPSSPDSPSRNLERTTSGTVVNRKTYTDSGSKTIRGAGMVPLARKISQPPAVSPFGGVAPSGPDAEEGLRAVRSREEEEERDALRKQAGPDPWAVRFEPGEQANPKVSGSVDLALLFHGTSLTLACRTGVWVIVGSSLALLDYSFSTRHLHHPPRQVSSVT